MLPLRGVTVLVLLSLACIRPLHAQSPDTSRIGALEHFRAASESTAHETWAGTGAWIGGIGGAIAFGAAFYHFSHRDGGAVNNTAGNLGGATVGAAFGAAGGALLGAFVGSLIEKK